MPGHTPREKAKKGKHRPVKVT
ncbi:hypothetical protein LCGC14_1930980, partial [marine sediment metagenome]